ncbi:hypothetical protein K4A83_13740 [Spirulina subsalsa FACHB-351]|uniref:DZANK-type domain-containing protein n=1 Tax=Spirulina subsalsa FACHB-351 TaxID=234711 RepID=A0ABT3L751_9CYAN|nr:hypothetical protein [Spirulina subsalsa]MCW6037325.1 hypothetical protein [Spirulina subsalsa FACHB-351]
MSHCPRCEKLIPPQAVQCPHCQMVLKGHGHPGIPLHQATGEAFLCETCLYHLDDSCNYPQRPYAKTCTLYCNSTDSPEDTPYRLSLQQQVKFWCQRNGALLLLLGLVLVSLAIALFN